MLQIGLLQAVGLDTNIHSFIVVVAVALIAGGAFWFLKSAWTSRSIAMRRATILEEFAPKIAHLRTREDLNEVILNMREQGTDTAVIDLIEEWGETLVFQSNGDSSTIKNVVDAEYFFGTDRLAPQLFRNRLLAGAPGFLTALGLVCTFLGLSLGLSGIDLDGSAEMLKAGVGDLVGSAGVAFVPSLFGVFFSVVVNFVTRRLQQKVSEKIRLVEEEIDRAVVRVSAEHLLNESVHMQRRELDFLNQTLSLQKSANELQEKSHALQDDGLEVIKELAEKVGTQVGETVAHSVEKLSTSLRLSIEESLAPALEQLTKNIVLQNTQVFDDLTQRMAEGFAEVGREQARELHTGADAIQNAVTSLSSGISEIQGETKALQDIIKHQATSLAGASEFVSKSAEALEAGASKFDGIAMQIRELQDSTTEKFEALLEEHTGIFANLEGYMLNLPQLQTKISATVTEISAASENLLASNQVASDALDTLANTTLALISQAIADNSNHASETYSRLSSELATSQKQMETWLREYSEAVGQHTNERMDTWNEQSSTYAKHMLSVSQTLQSVISEIQDQQQEIAETVDRTKANSAALSYTHEKFAETMTTTSTIVPALADNVKALQLISQRILEVKETDHVERPVVDVPVDQSTPSHEIPILLNSPERLPGTVGLSNREQTMDYERKDLNFGSALTANSESPESANNDLAPVKGETR